MNAAAKLHDAAEKAATSGHPDNTEVARIFFQKIILPLFPESVAEQLTIDEIEDLLVLMKVSFSQGFNAAYDLGEPNRRAADAAADYIAVLNARGSAAKKASTLEALKEAVR
jgi:hypothetical protein